MKEQQIDKINNLTKGERMFNKGDYVLVRSENCGVHYGVYESKAGNELVLKKARRLYYWVCNRGISLSDIAQYGFNKKESKVCAELPYIHLLGVIEIIPVNEKHIKAFKEAKEYTVS